ncbi:hypothetical protein BLX42_10680 [Pseudomonas sp. SG-MS2]|uniref:AraC family transcriptional regulator n=1 Tax=Pseudomonas TaxID=286 RepID=UPI000CFB9B85|nr:MULTISPECIES: AraC family transcriptional regulator [unclassified Pseudomonas]KAF1311053.1 hypothetical protein BLX42_10680 [Pseudomonas sp. SG-MS2]PRA59417.1 hypothetical protein CQ065_22100 [Pseudomonas sp. MYb187]
MDLLGEVLLSLKIGANSVGIFHCGAPWGMDVPAMTQANAYMFCAIDTPFWLMLENKPPQLLEPGDAALILHGPRYSFASTPNAPCVALETYWELKQLPWLTAGSRQNTPLHGLTLGMAPHTDRVLTMGILIGGATDNHLLRALPDVITLKRSARGQFPWIPSLLEFLAAEQSANTPGYTATASHLAELIFTSLVRAYVLNTPAGSSSWLSGINDPRISRALAAIHSKPEHPWTLERLADQAGMSRFSFSRLFSKRTGQTPIEYLIERRMQLAAELVLEGRSSVARIAEAVGYQSERAFRGLFIRHFGMPPREYAKHHSDRR